MKPRTLLNKDSCDSIEEAFTGCVSIAKWKYNKIVNVVSNKLRAEPMQKEMGQRVLVLILVRSGVLSPDHSDVYRCLAQNYNVCI